MKSDNYIPTTAEQKLLNVLAEPENRTKSVTDICKLAKISRDTYYKVFKNPEFVEYYQRLSFNLVKQSVMPVINAVVEQAKSGSFNHAKLILEMADIYAEKTRRDMFLQGSLDVNQITEKEADELIKQFIVGGFNDG